jgi:hypothetical protein
VRFLSVLLLVLISLAAQVPRIGIIDFYGIHKTPAEKIRKALGVTEGDPLPPSKLDAEKRIETLPGIVEARIEAVCCEDGKAILYVGVEEKGDLHFDLHSSPASSDALPAAIVETYRNLLDVSRAAGQAGLTGEDLTNGYPLMADSEGRVLQQKLLADAVPNLSVIRKVLRDAEDPEQRAIAAYVIAYAPKKPEVIDDLQWAMQDPDSAVRANAMASLEAANVLAVLRPDLRIRISPTWFVEMLNSIDWNDRHRAVTALVTLTDRRDPGTLAELRQRALASLAEMARWKSLPHALPAYILLGRLAGFSEQTIQDTWSAGNRDAGIRRMLAEISGKGKKR